MCATDNLPGWPALSASPRVLMGYPSYSQQNRNYLGGNIGHGWNQVSEQCAEPVWFSLVILFYE